MKNTLAIILLMPLLATSCNSGSGGSSKENTPLAATGDNGTVPATGNGLGNGSTTSTLPAKALSFATNVTLYSFANSQEDKYNEAIAIVKKVVGTEAFRTKVLNHTYGGAKTFVQNNGLTNAQIYAAILDAAEKLTPAKNNTLDVGVKLYYQNSSVVGYTNSSISYINVNTKFFNNFDVNEVAGNLFHEWLHKQGYSHDSASTARRPYSVPYAVGYMVRELGKNFI